MCSNEQINGMRRCFAIVDDVESDWSLQSWPDNPFQQHVSLFESRKAASREKEDLFPNVVTEPRGRLDDSVGFASRRLESE